MVRFITLDRYTDWIVAGFSHKELEKHIIPVRHLGLLRVRSLNDPFEYKCCFTHHAYIKIIKGYKQWIFVRSSQ